MEKLLTGISAVDWGMRLRPLANVWLGAGVLAALAALLIVVLDPGFAVRELSDMMQRRANLQFTSSAARFQFFPQPALSLQGVRLVAADGSGYQLMTVETATIPMSLRTLLTRRLEPRSIILDGPVINILIDAKGHAGWSGKGDALDQALAQNSEPGEGLKATTIDGTIKFLDEASGQAFQLEQADLDLTFGRTGAADVQGTAAISQQFARIEMHLASVARLFEDGSPIDVLVTAPAVEASFSGLVKMRGGLTMAGTFAAGSDSVSRLANWMGLQQLSQIDLQELRMSGPLLLKNGTISSGDLILRLGNMEMKGQLSLATAQRPLLKGGLSTNRLAFNAAGSGDLNASGPGWATTPFKLAWVNDIDLDLVLDATSLAWRRLTVGPAKLHINSVAGTLKAELERTAAYGGNMEAQLTLRTSGDQPSAELRLLGEQMDLGQFGRDLAGKSSLKAHGNINLDVTAEGATLEEMVSTLAGTASVSVSEGSFTGIDMPASIAAAASAEQQGWTSTAGSTDVSDGRANFALKDGIASSEDLVIKVAGVKLGAQGNIDLLRKAVDLSLRPIGKTETLAIRAFGAWDKPKLAAIPAKGDNDIKKPAKKDSDLLVNPEGN